MLLLYTTWREGFYRSWPDFSPFCVGGERVDLVGCKINCVL